VSGDHAEPGAGSPAEELLAVRDRTLVMGVVNVTPDSFSDGGEWFEPEAAVARGLEVLAAGADIIDVGGESTRPGADRPSVKEELRRVLPVVSALAEAGAVVSIDTMRAQVAEAAMGVGAGLVNDVSGGLADPAMVPLVGGAGWPYIAMHWRGHSADMQSRAVYGDVVEDVCRELAIRRDELLGAGLAEERLVLDPGLGFAKTAEHNWSLLAALPRLQALGQPILLGASRKAFLGRVGRTAEESPRPAADRDPETTATSVLAGLAGTWCVRVHDVGSTVRALAVVAAARAHAHASASRREATSQREATSRREASPVLGDSWRAPDE
jgi:dihydropteroate synthase